MTNISTITAYLEHQSKQPNHCDFKDWVIDALAVMSETDARSLMFSLERNDSGGRNLVCSIIERLLINEHGDKADEWEQSQSQEIGRD